MKTTVIIILLISPFNLLGQSQDLVDSISSAICKSIMSSKEEKDTIKVFHAFKEQANTTLLSNFTTTERDSIGQNIYFRLQRNCKIFKEILIRNSSENKYWKVIYEKPQSKADAKICADFFKHTKFTYFETNGDTVHLKIENNFWIDNFIDGTYSKLKITKGRYCEFDIEFIESNNNSRKNFSKSGDKYKYTIIDKSEDFYLMSVEIIGLGSYSIFKLYY